MKKPPNGKQRANSDPLAAPIADMRRLFAEQYDRGISDATSRIIAAAQQGPNNPGSGATLATIDAALSRGALTIKQIAASEANVQGISLGAIERSLRRAARRSGRYRNEGDGRWSLAQKEPAAQSR